MGDRKYYEAYDDRYRQAHAENLQWFTNEFSEIIGEVIEQYGIQPSAHILEIGCGEGRDARHLLKAGYDVLATDVSPEAISYCRSSAPESADRFQVLDCLRERLPGRYDFIYAVAVVHMLVPDEDRAGFYRFIHEQLASDGIALVCTMGDGTFERQSDLSTAFELQERTHEESGRTLHVAGTSCRVINFPTFERELHENSFEILQQGVTSISTIFPVMMYAVVRKKREEVSAC